MIESFLRRLEQLEDRLNDVAERSRARARARGLSWYGGWRCGDCGFYRASHRLHRAAERRDHRCSVLGRLACWGRSIAQAVGLPTTTVRRKLGRVKRRRRSTA